MSNEPTKHIYGKCLKCSARWWLFTLPTNVRNIPKKAACPNCYAKGYDVALANNGEHSEYKPTHDEKGPNETK